jgi:dTDP-4-dehydrorhamnose reductase
VVKGILVDYPSAKVINFSSYYVYDDEGLCGEGAQTTDRYFYTRHKLASEKLVTDNGGVCFRLGKLFGHTDVEKQNKLTEHIIKSKQVTLDKVSFNPTSLKQVLDVIVFELENKCLSGLYNLSNSGNTSHLEYGEYINERLGGRLRIEQIEKFERGFHNYGRFLMNTGKIEDVVTLRTWQEDLEEYLSEGGF